MTSAVEDLKVGDRVRVQLSGPYWQTTGWFEGTIVRIDPFSAHRRFHWVELDAAAAPVGGGTTNLVAILNPKHLVKV